MYQGMQSGRVIPHRVLVIIAYAVGDEGRGWESEDCTVFCVNIRLVADVGGGDFLLSVRKHILR